MEKDVNGCGGKGGWIKPPLAIFFEASCNKHDELYTIGGTEYDRYLHDVKLLELSMIDCYRVKNRFKRVFYQFWSLSYFLMVRGFGKKYFNYEIK